MATQLSAQILQQQCFHRKMLLKVLSTLRYLVRQGLAIRGHHDDDGNLIQLLNCRSEDITSLRSWMLDRKYLSHDIINEQIAIMARWVVNTLITDIKMLVFSLLLQMKLEMFLVWNNLLFAYVG